MAEQWSPWFAWIMDLVKFLITFCVTALVTVSVINRIEARRAVRKSRADVLFQFQLDALREFRQKAATYEVAALAAYTEIYQWKGVNKTDAMQRYEGTAYGDFVAALDGLAHRFKGNEKAVGLITDLRQRHEKRHKIYDQLVDVQLDSGSGVKDMWTRADQTRKEFDTFLSEATLLRQAIIAAIENDILAAV